MVSRITTGGLAFGLALLGAGYPAGASQLSEARAKIKHVVIIMQENRSFDTYFGTYPGADGLPKSGPCLPYDLTNPTEGCVSPYYDPDDRMTGGPHGAYDGQFDVDDGITTAKLDGFVADAERVHGMNCRKNPNGPFCPGLFPNPDAMGYHDSRDLPVYWSLAHNYLLQDRMFEGVRSWSNDAHIDMASEWTANCTDDQDQTTCITTSNIARETKDTVFPWASLMVLLDAHQVSWKWYLGEGLEPDCESGLDDCDPQPQLARVPSIWNPVPYFKYVQQQGRIYLNEHNPPMDQFLLDVQSGNLPQVSWIMPSAEVSEHPQHGSNAGQDYVASLVNAVMNSPEWDSTVIFLAWDDWGGFYDHVEPPISVITDVGDPFPVEGFGLRVPAMTISPYARHGIDHQTLSFENYARFIEDLFANSARLVPAALGLPDSRPIIPDSLQTVSFVDGHTESVGDLLNEFAFSQPPRPAVIQPTTLPNEIQIACVGGSTGGVCNTDNVKLGWNSLTGPNVPETFTYHVSRDGVDLPGCVTTGTTCTDTAPSGYHEYRVTSIGTSGVSSPQAAGIHITLP